MLAEDIRRIVVARDPLKAYDSSCDGLAHTVIGQRHMSLIELRLRNRGTVDD
jgi:hypothetical protein